MPENKSIMDYFQLARYVCYAAYLKIHIIVLNIQEIEIVLDSLNIAIAKIKRLIGKTSENILVHQDQGSQFTSYEYVDRVLKNGMILSYSTPGTPTDNPGQESFFGRLKDECQDEFNETRSFKQLNRIMKRRINYYNKKRIHTSIQLKSPEKFTINFIKNISLNKLLK